MTKDTGDAAARPGLALPSGVEPASAVSSTAAIPIARTDIECARRTLCRHFAAALIRAMAETDTGLDAIDWRLSWKTGTARRYINSLINGRDVGSGLVWVAEFAFAMDCEIDFQLAPAQGIEARSGETDEDGLDPKGESPVAAGDAPKEDHR